jgi:hypothetical protein
MMKALARILFVGDDMERTRMASVRSSRRLTQVFGRLKASRVRLLARKICPPLFGESKCYSRRSSRRSVKPIVDRR